MCLFFDEPDDPSPEEARERRSDDAGADSGTETEAASREEADGAADEIQDPSGFPPAGPVGDFRGVLHGDLSGQFQPRLNMFI